MLKDLKERTAYWDVNHLAYQQGDSIKVPFEKYKHFFDYKKVLEIGPGEGRQFEVIFDRSKEYAVADISQAVLNESVYKNIANKYLISNYATNNFNNSFDVIHFWYVLHHILSEELNDFILFLYRHLTDEGLIIFNTPYLDYDKGNYLSNGIMTTTFTIEDVEQVLATKFEIIVKDKSIWMNSNGYVVIARKI